MQKLRELCELGALCISCSFTVYELCSQLLRTPNLAGFSKGKQGCVTWSCTEDYFNIPSFWHENSLLKETKAQLVPPQNEMVAFSMLLKIFVIQCVPLVSDWWSHNINCSDFIGVIFFIITVWNSEVIHTTPRQ